MTNKKPALNKSELITLIAEATNLPKNQINQIFYILEEIVSKSMKSGKSVTIPNLCKIYVHKRPARSARQMKSPATGEMINVPAKPAKTVVKVRALKNLKEMI